jgi:peptidoglycan/LPS O-acetylase OafA/YrhL
VDLFFALSAYLITELLRREKLATGKVDIRAFYTRRILRIWPLYFAYLAFWFAARRLIPTGFPLRALAAFVFFCGNWYIAGSEANGTPFRSPVAPFWSISVEEQFYLIWPAAARFAGRAGMTALAAGLAAAAWVAQWRLFRGGAVHGTIWVDSMVHGGAIGLGVVSAALLEGRAPRIPRPLRLAMFAAALALLGVSDAVFHFADAHLSVRDGMSSYGCGLLAVALFFYAFLGAPGDGLKLAAGRTPAYLGQISYGLYAFHIAALGVVKYLMLRYSGGCPPWVRFGVALPVTIALAAASYRWFESPFLALKRRFTWIRSGAA